MTTREIFRRFALGVVLPVILAMAAAAFLVERAHQRHARASVERAARVTLGTLSQELGAAVSALVATAEALPDADTTVGAVRAALRGDTVRALDPTASGVDVMVLAPDSARRGVRFNAGRMEPGGPDLVGGVWGIPVALYANGRVWASTDPPPGPPVLDDDVLDEAAHNPDGAWTHRGFVLALDPREGARPAVVVLASSPELKARAISYAVYASVAALLALTFGVVWLLHRRAGGAALRRVLPPLALLPALLAAALFYHFDVAVRAQGTASLSRDLARALAVAEEMGLLSSTEHFQALTGIDAVWVERGEPAQATSQELSDAARTLRAPPPNFTSTGTVQTVGGAWRYVARRTGPGAFVVVGAPLPAREQRQLRVALGVLALLMTAGVAAGAGAVVRAIPRVGPRA